MNNDEMLKKVILLLQSDIESHKISNGTGISSATISKLRNGNKNISKSSYETVSKLYKYYLDKESYLEQAKNLKEDILNIKLPKDIQIFISSLKNIIDRLNDNSSELSIKEILFEKKFTMTKDKKSSELISTIKIDELVPIQIKRNTFAYNLKIIKDYIDEHSPIKSINNYHIDFAYNDLEIDLKHLIYKGDRVTLIKSNLDELGETQTGLYVSSAGYNYEYNFIKLYVFEDYRKEEKNE
ncbi:TPA: hypothetical protein KED73_002677 [Staphylococcus aureus]|nr:hypothetical protein [Staphylococcus aureus]